MRYITLKCEACGEVNDIICDPDIPMYCPDCLALDEFEELKKTCDYCHKNVDDFYTEGACSKSCYQGLIAESKHYYKH